MSRVVYIRHIPDGFFESQMTSYFNQFGKVTRAKLARSTKSGRSKGFAFVEFADAKVAEIAAKTMDNYLMFEKILKCRQLAEAELKANTFKHWDAGIHIAPGRRINAARHNRFRSDVSLARSRQRLADRLAAKNARLASMGVAYRFELDAELDKKKCWDVKEEVLSGDEEEAGMLNYSITTADGEDLLNDSLKPELDEDSEMKVEVKDEKPELSGLDESVSELSRGIKQKAVVKSKRNLRCSKKMKKKSQTIVLDVPKFRGISMLKQ